MASGLPAAMDNRPLKFEEFETMQNQVIYVSQLQQIMKAKNRGCCCGTSNPSYRIAGNRNQA
jgi:excinuclease UvrABC helicase subunit UvrB